MDSEAVTAKSEAGYTCQESQQGKRGRSEAGTGRVVK